MSDGLPVRRYPQQHLEEERSPEETGTDGTLGTLGTLLYVGYPLLEVYDLHLRKTSRGSADQEDGGVLQAVRHFRDPRKAPPIFSQENEKNMGDINFHPPETTDEEKSETLGVVLEECNRAHTVCRLSKREHNLGEL